MILWNRKLVLLSLRLTLKNIFSICLSSVMDQTLKNIEIIVINDGSTEASR
ncbi:glycosyltransferase family A protein [Desulfocapsa sulfexigens]|uniref:glycosyltransferase family A protein n=1 Tax=Desulfocapsa sulfexigens TaxID=65555 RepID=UPI00389968E8